MKNEYKFLTFFNIQSFFLGIGLSRILANTKEMFFVSIILGTIMGILILKLMNISMKKSFINVIITSILFIISLMVLTNMISTMYLTEMPKLLVGIPILIVLIYIIKQKEIVYFRITNILIVINILFLIISVLALVPYIKLIYFSYSNTSINDILLTSLEYALISTTPIMISKGDNVKNISIIKTYILTSLIIAILAFLTLGILGPNMVGVYRYPEYIILKKITLFQNSANLENIICFYWIFNVLIFLITCANRLKSILGFKKGAIILTLLLLLTSYFNSDYIYIIFIYKYTYIVFGISLIILLLFNINKKRLKK